VNFTAIPHKNSQNDNADHASTRKRLFFAELMLVPELQLNKDAEPMRVLHVSTIDDVPCYGMLYIQVCLYMYFGILCRSVNKLPFFLI
jgi:hypothetical protein